MQLVKNLLILLMMATFAFQIGGCGESKEKEIKEVKIVKINNWSIYR